MVGVTRYAAGAIRGNNAIQTDGDPISGVYQAAKSTPSKAFSVQVWFKTTTAAGGKIAGFENVQVGEGQPARSVAVPHRQREAGLRHLQRRDLEGGEPEGLQQRPLAPGDGDPGPERHAAVRRRCAGREQRTDRCPAG
jgi:hypothetical protein